MEHSNTAVEQILQTIEDMSAQLARLKSQVMDNAEAFDESHAVKKRAERVGATGEDQYGAVIEGVFDGQQMIGPDGAVYNMPANYASKSKLVEGDIMKLTITDDGAFIYKQIGPVARKRLVGSLVYDDTVGMYRGIDEDGRSYKLLTASVTYYKGQSGDHIILLVPEDGQSRWAAVENIISASEDAPTVEGVDAESFGGVSDVPSLDTEHELTDGSDIQLLSGEDIMLDEPAN